MAVNNNQPSGWTGWVVFAGFMMIVMGMLQAISGLAALLNSDWLLVTEQSLVAFDFTTWGWIHLLIGAVVFSAGFAVMNGAVWARVIGVIIAMISLVANLAYANTYPIWAIAVVIIDVLIIYALTVRGGELRN
jgi:hypothetical protein